MTRHQLRFFAAGILVGLRLTAAPPAVAVQTARPTHQALDWYVAGDGALLPIRTAEDWAARRAAVLANVQAVMGSLPPAEARAPLAPQVLEEAVDGAIRRRKIAFHTDSDSATVRAWLLMPAGATTVKRPAVLCLHQTIEAGKDEPAGLAGKESLHYARHLAERGFITLAPDYPSLGEYQYDFAADDYQSGSMKAIYDNVRAVDYLASLPEVDGERIGAIGHSLGGHNAIFTAVFEPRLKAVVSCCGFTAFHRYYGGKLEGWSGPRYMPLIRERYACDPDEMPFDFAELIAALAPRPFLAVAPLHDDNFDVAGVRQAMAAARPIYELLRAGERLQAVYPDAGHDFPPAAREQAYAFLEQWLGLGR
ncbi:MAG: prolyl oligopeptidase family serine peptidase [Pirellulales bacterium]|nr:prolyl oligopeptidase family serine peptidase [Pirellulales bacterium]